MEQVQEKKVFVIDNVAASKFMILFEMLSLIIMAPSEVETNALLIGIKNAFGALMPYDAGMYYLLGRYGYKYSKHYAYSEGYPFMLSCLHSIFGDTNVLVLGCILNLVVSIISALVLYKLCVNLYPAKQGRSYICSMLFALSPASVFYMNLHSDSIFTLVTLLGLYCIQVNTQFIGSAILCISALISPYGISNVCMIIYSVINGIYNRKHHKVLYTIASTIFNISSMLLALSYLVSRCIKYHIVSAQGFTNGITAMLPHIYAELPNLVMYLLIFLFTISILNDITAHTDKNVNARMFSKFLVAHFAIHIILLLFSSGVLVI